MTPNPDQPLARHDEPAESRLTVVGTGIGFRRQLIPAAESAIREADKVLYQLGDPLTARWLQQLQPNAESLAEPTTSEPILSSEVYEAMAEQVFATVFDSQNVCFVTYGHPGLYQHAAHRSIELVRGAGMVATMLPGISALDCLIADLDIEIGAGCQILDATSLVVQRKILDPTSALVLFQAGIFGNPYYGAKHPVALQLLGDRLRNTWGPDQQAIFYEAPMTPNSEPIVDRVPLSELEVMPMTERTLMYVAPASGAKPDVVAAAQIGAWLASLR